MKLDWTGETAAVICSGPSLTAADCNMLRGLKTIVTNTSFRMAPWADVVFAFDTAWWVKYMHEVMKLDAARYTMQPGSSAIYARNWAPNFGNSGACAIGLAIVFGAKKVILLGADCKKGEKAHWHEDHPAPLRNAPSIEKWPAEFKAASDYAEIHGVDVVNCTRDTALECFRRGRLEDHVWTPAC